MRNNILLLEYARLYNNCEVYLKTFQGILELLNKSEVSRKEVVDLIGEAVAKSIRPPITDGDREAAERQFVAKLRKILE